ncbi:hypothetical protein [Geomonas anaerohicana]|uniref:DUF4760 domain-containing protein n=1 Tax=Geomonas anaerohicana TaxID=2798583 RepID=A0ABS0YFR5_9BACT|nr:hypothetical protein [Geomonas anaerohicana]MBJ6750737.1 hypothetical protein [Geomonas anaerohicana]
MTMANLLQSVPSQAWIALATAILSSGMTLLGVWLSNRATNQRVKLQLEHDQKIKYDDIIRNRLEELYVESKRYLNHLCSYYLPYRQVMKGELNFNQALDLTISSAENAKFDPNRVTLLIHMYFPEVQLAFDDIMTIREKLNDIVSGYKKQYKGGNSDGRNWLKEFQPLLELLAKKCGDFDDEVVKLKDRCTVGSTGSLRAP